MFNTKTQKVAFNTIFQIVGKVVSTTLSLIVVASLTRYLGVEAYGEYTTIFAYVAFAAVIADFGFFWVLVRELSKGEDDKSKYFNNVLSFKIIFSIVVFVLFSLIAFCIPQYNQTIKIGILVISFGWFWSSLNSTYVGLFQTKLEMYKAVITDVVGRIIILFGILYLISHNYSLDMVLIVNVIGNFFNFLLSFYLGQKYIKFKFSYDLSLWKLIFRESYPLAILTLVGTVNFRIDTIILSILKNQVDVGIYGIPYKILEIIIVLPTIFMGNMLPILIGYFHSKDNRLVASIQKSFDFIIFLAFPVVAGLSVLARPIIKLIGGGEYISASTISFLGLKIAAPEILFVLSVSIGFAFLTVMFSNLIIVVGKQQKQVLPMFIVMIVNVVLNLIFIPRYSYLAASFANLLSNILLLVWWNHLAHKYVNFDLSYKNLLKVSGATIIMGIFLYFFKDYNIFAVIISGSVVYFVVSYFLKVFDKNMIMRLVPGNGAQSGK